MTRQNVAPLSTGANQGAGTKAARETARVLRSDAQARRVEALAALVRSGRYVVPGRTIDGAPLRGYRLVS